MAKAKVVKQEIIKMKRLTQRDIIQKGDEYRTSWGTWTEIEDEFIGKRKGAVFSHTLKMRRKEKPKNDN
jgi:hypothetical protein